MATKIHNRWYFLAIQTKRGWKEHSMEYDSKRDAFRAMRHIDYWGMKVRVIQHYHASKPIGRSLDRRKENN